MVHFYDQCRQIYHTFSVWAWVDILNSKTVVGWFGVKYLDLWFASMLHLPQCINPRVLKGSWNLSPVYQGLLFGLLLKNAWFPNRKWCTLDLSFPGEKFKSHFFFWFFGHFLKCRLFIWIGADLPSPHHEVFFFNTSHVSCFQPLQMSQVQKTTSVPPKSRVFGPRGLVRPQSWQPDGHSWCG